MSNQAFKGAVKLRWIIDLRFRFQNTDVRFLCRGINKSRNSNRTWHKNLCGRIRTKINESI